MSGVTATLFIAPCAELPPVLPVMAADAAPVPITPPKAADSANSKALPPAAASANRPLAAASANRPLASPLMPAGLPDTAGGNAVRALIALAIDHEIIATRLREAAAMLPVRSPRRAEIAHEATRSECLARYVRGHAEMLTAAMALGQMPLPF